MKINPAGTDWVYSGFIGGSGTDLLRGHAAAVDVHGNLYVSGYTNSPDFPTTPSGFDTTPGGDQTVDAFISKITSDGTALGYSTYYGGSGNDEAYDLALDPSANVYVVGNCETDFPYLVGPDLTQNSGTDAFVGKVAFACPSLTVAPDALPAAPWVPTTLKHWRRAEEADRTDTLPALGVSLPDWRWMQTVCLPVHRLRPAGPALM